MYHFFISYTLFVLLICSKGFVPRKFIVDTSRDIIEKDIVAFASVASVVFV